MNTEKLIIFAIVAFIVYCMFFQKEGFQVKEETLTKLKKIENDYIQKVIGNLKTGFYNKKAVGAAENYNAYIDEFAPEFVDPNTTQARKDEILAEVRRLGKIYDTEAKLMKETVKMEVDKAMTVIKFRTDFRNADGTFKRNPGDKKIPMSLYKLNQSLYDILGSEYERLYKEFAPNQVWSTI
jgi:hypothetical protein